MMQTMATTNVHRHRSLIDDNRVQCVRVAARADDGFFYPGVIVNSGDIISYGQRSYTMIFDNGQCSRVNLNRIVGDNFQCLGNACALRYGQVVYVDYYGSQVAAMVIDHNVRDGEVRLQLYKQPDVTIVRNVTEVKLMPTISSKHRNRYCLQSSSPFGFVYNFNNQPVKSTERGLHLSEYRRESLDDENVMGEEEAALVLTNLCNSPISNGETTQKASTSPEPEADKDYLAPISNRSTCSYSPILQEQQFIADPSKNDRSSVKTVYCCTWPKCRKVLSTYPGIVRHIRTIHFCDNTEKLDNGEEEFYFTEVEVTVDSLANEMANTKPASPTQSLFMKEQNTYMARKSKGDGKKCRKVYGMDNRHLWCTQCRWKKACTRFVD